MIFILHAHATSPWPGGWLCPGCLCQDGVALGNVPDPGYNPVDRYKIQPRFIGHVEVHFSNPPNMLRPFGVRRYRWVGLRVESGCVISTSPIFRAGWT